MLGFRRFVLDQLNFVPQYYWWLAPLVTAGTVVMVSVGLGILVPIRWARTRQVAWFAIPIALLVVTILIRLLGERLDPAAVWLLAAGVGVQAGRSMAKHPDRWLGIVARAAIPLGLVPVLCGLVLLVERLRSPEPDGAAAPGSPNVLLLILDTVRADDLGLYGGPVPETSRALSRLAEDGVTFDDAYSTTSWSGPSHGSVFTGRWAHELSIDWQIRLDGTFPTLAEVLQSRGYATVGFSANVLYASRETGLARGIGHYEDYPFVASRLPLIGTLGRHLGSMIGRGLLGLEFDGLEGRVTASNVTERFLRWIDRRDPGRPFYAFLNLFDAHAPYYPSDSLWTRLVGPGPRRRLSLPLAKWKPEAVALRHRAYVAAIADQDAVVGRLLTDLERRGLLDRTIVVVTSDHGEEFLEHGVMGHGHSLYRPSLQVPLVIRAPGDLVPKGLRVRTTVSNRQVAATIAELLRLEQSPFPGPSLSAAWRAAGEETPPLVFSLTTAPNLPPTYPVSGGALRSVLFRSHQLIVGADGTGALFDLGSDRGQLVDLTGRPASARLGAELRDTLEQRVPPR